MIDSRATLRGMMPDSFRFFFDGRQPYENQALSMPEIVKGHNVLLASPTASGKTEAAIAPLFQRHLSFNRQSLSTIFVAPTKALVNDLHERLQDSLGIDFPEAITRYTGDRHEFRSPFGKFCLLVTPEALDSLQIRCPKSLFHVRAIVVDEIHLLHGQPRGQQLRHVIDRIRHASKCPRSKRDNFQVVGMTATIYDLDTVAKIWLGKDAKVFQHGASREINLEMIDLPHKPECNRYQIQAEFFTRWLVNSQLDKILLFANRRNDAHELTSYLKKNLSGQRWPLHLHFGILPSDVRERIEQDMRKDKFGVCVATSTLEVGIDIGDIDAVVLADPPSSVSSFLQRIGRGNRRNDICRVIGFRNSENDDRIFRALVDCARHGMIEDAHEYDRASVRFQQVLSLCWRAVNEGYTLTPSSLAREAGTDDHRHVINDMITTGCLNRAGNALVPQNMWIDKGNAGEIHTVISGGLNDPVFDAKTGMLAMHGIDDSSSGSAVFFDGEMRQITSDSEGTFLSGHALPSQRLAKIRATGRHPPAGRNLIWGLARDSGHDPEMWELFDRQLNSWGGLSFNLLIAEFFRQSLPSESFKPSPTGVEGPVSSVEISLSSIYDWSNVTEKNKKLPRGLAEKFVNATLFLKQLSPELADDEKRRSVPWRSFRRWIKKIKCIKRMK